jgi:hypothetical protein
MRFPGLGGCLIWEGNARFGVWVWDSGIWGID